MTSQSKPEAQLTIEFSGIAPEDEGFYEPWDSFTLHLTRHDYSSDDFAGTRLRVLDAVQIYQSDGRQVCRGAFAKSGPNDPTGDIALKLVATEYADDVDLLKRELSFYNNELLPLQGHVVPKCYGLFEGNDPTGKSVMCLALQYVGQPVPDEGLRTLRMDERLDILEALVRVHLAGVQHNDVRQDNLRRKNDAYSRGPWVIDFGNAEKHDCMRCMSLVEGAVAPFRHEFGCDELWEMCFKVGIWRSRYVKWYGTNIPEECVTSPQVLVDAAREACAPTPKEKISAMAQAEFERVQRYKKNGGLRPRSDIEPDDAS